MVWILRDLSPLGLAPFVRRANFVRIALCPKDRAQDGGAKLLRAHGLGYESGAELFGFLIEGRIKNAGCDDRRQRRVR